MTPATMTASVLTAPGSLTIEQREVPSPDPGDVLVQVSAVGVCGSDTHYYRHGRIGDFVVSSPLVLGHEAAGRIVAVGSGVPESRIGERVSIEPQRPDPDDEPTRRGQYNLSPHMRFYATPPVDGALAEFVTIGSAFAHPVPDSVSDEAAALFEPLSVAIAACRKAEVGIGDGVLITGAGPVGLLCVQVARAAGATRIVVTDVNRTRLAVAAGFGATEVLTPDELDTTIGVDSFIDASGAESAISSGIAAVRPGGRVVLVGMSANSTMAFPISLVQNRELVVTGVFRYANTWPIARELVTSGKVDLDSMVTGRFGLSEVAEALDADRQPGSIKAVVYPGRLGGSARAGAS
ncbi:NAD(P)-dependent alcohol dehydrogenase [Williamsia muralis]|uniref:NAD(P)-dependent alcohol dehydrogenase n=1 Tax=Williamsia marianensis TaxID=85044 RepID=UPI000DE6DDE2|nr:NAD(P)-dependent alcohol dehydrogenase [Williamsia marianensis]PVY33801.1 L-iditol 2-dehydrogenase [Williamsia marianensis]